MKKLMIGMGIIAASFVSIEAAAERYVLRMNDLHLRGQKVIKLRKELREQRGVSSQGLKLKKVVLVAKSKHGGGTAKLIVGNDESHSETLDGVPYDFHNTDRYTYSRVVIKNPKYDSSGKWQIHTRGNIKIKKIVIITEDRWDDPSSGHVRNVDLGQVRFDKFIENEKRLYVGKEGVQSIKIRATRNEVYVSYVKVRYENGRTEYLYDLEGYLNDGRTKTAFLSNRYGHRVESVVVAGTSSDYTGRRGELHISAEINTPRRW